MRSKDFYVLFGGALEATSYDQYIAEWSSSSIFYPDDDSDPSSDEIISQLHTVWKAAHITVKEIREHAGLTQAALSERFCIPINTMYQWESGKRTPPDYVRLMLAELTGAVKIERV